MFTRETPAAASTSAIPFGQAPAAPVGGSGAGFLLAFILLAAAFGVLWFIRRRGFGLVTPPSSVPTGEGWTIVQRLRLTPTAQAVVLKSATESLVVVESRYGVQVTRMSANEVSP